MVGNCNQSQLIEFVAVRDTDVLRNRACEIVSGVCGERGDINKEQEKVAVEEIKLESSAETGSMWLMAVKLQSLFDGGLNIAFLPSLPVCSL